MANPGDRGCEYEENWWQHLLDDYSCQEALFNVNDQLDRTPDDDSTEYPFPGNYISEGNQDEAGRIRSNCRDQESQNSPQEDGLPVILEFPELTPTPIHEVNQAASRTEPPENQTVAGIEQRLGQLPAAISTVDSRSTRTMGEMSAATHKRLARKRECDRKYRQRKKEKTQKLEGEIQEKDKQIKSVEAFDAAIRQLKAEMGQLKAEIQLRNKLEDKEQLTIDGIGSLAETNDCTEIDDKDNIWNDSNELIFIGLMVEEVKKGNLTTGTFSKLGWRNIVQGLKEKTGRDYTNPQLKRKYQSLRLRHRKFTALIRETGIGYNFCTGEVIASEDVWVTLRKVHSLATRFRKKGCKEYKDLCLIFDETTASGNHQHASTKLPLDGEDESHGTNLPGLSLGDSEDDVTELPYNNEMEPRATKESPMCTPKKKKGPRGRRTFSQVIEKALQPLLTISEQSKRKNDLLEQRMSGSSVGDNRDEANSGASRDVKAMKECLRSLGALGLEGIAYGKAVKALHDSALYREIFSEMSDREKRDWILAL